MALQRQNRNIRRCVVLTVMVVACAATLPARAQVTTERVVIDRHSGLAIGGHDPVAYFAAAQPARGDAAFEAVHDGAIWRFVNEGNRLAFIADPEVYAPQLGGYDPLDVARGVAVAGLPQVFCVVDDQLFLFSSEAHARAFLDHPAQAREAALRRWPSLRAMLAP